MMIPSIQITTSNGATVSLTQRANALNPDALCVSLLVYGPKDRDAHLDAKDIQDLIRALELMREGT